MAEIIANEGGGKQKGKKRAKRHSTHIDMTPMVDLACLLLTFFMLTTAFAKAKVMEIVLPERTPKEKKNDAPQVDKDRALNIILVAGDKVLWYNGLADPTKPPLPTLTETDFSDEGIRKVVLHRNKDLFIQIETMNKDLIEGKIKLPKDTVTARRKKMMINDNKGPVILIKAADDVKYRNIVDIIDEMAICNVARYALVDINVVEKKMVADYLAGKTSGAASIK
jgi:biopolymer transport protein ExbD